MGNLENLALERCGGRLPERQHFSPWRTLGALAMKERQCQRTTWGKSSSNDEIFHKQIFIIRPDGASDQSVGDTTALNGAMFYTIKQINGYVSENRWIWTREDTLLPRQDGGEITIWSINGFLEILQRGTWNSPGAQSIPTT